MCIRERVSNRYADCSRWWWSIVGHTMSQCWPRCGRLYRRWAGARPTCSKYCQSRLGSEVDDLSPAYTRRTFRAIRIVCPTVSESAHGTPRFIQINNFNILNILSGIVLTFLYRINLHANLSSRYLYSYS